jgi:hypothetical protein
MRLDGCRRRVGTVRNRHARPFEDGARGRRRRSDRGIPRFVAQHRIGRCPLPLPHGSAHPRHPRIARSSGEA